MRIFFSIALLTLLVAAVASIDTTTAKQHTTATIDPIGMTVVKTGLPEWKFDLY